MVNRDILDTYHKLKVIKLLWPWKNRSPLFNAHIICTRKNAVNTNHFPRNVENFHSLYYQWSRSAEAFTLYISVIARSCNIAVYGNPSHSRWTLRSASLNICRVPVFRFITKSYRRIVWTVSWTNVAGCDNHGISMHYALSSSWYPLADRITFGTFRIRKKGCKDS